MLVGSHKHIAAAPTSLLMGPLSSPTPLPSANRCGNAARPFKPVSYTPPPLFGKAWTPPRLPPPPGLQWTGSPTSQATRVPIHCCCACALSRRQA